MPQKGGQFAQGQPVTSIVGKLRVANFLTRSVESPAATIRQLQYVGIQRVFRFFTLLVIVAIVFDDNVTNIPS